MDPENKEETSLDDEIGQVPKDFGKVIDTLHSKAKLPSLRTYQGDMAEFIKEKNESVISIAVKEKERKEGKKEEAEKLELPLKSNKSNKQSLQIKFTIIFLSLLLIVAGAVSFYYVFIALKKQQPVAVVLEEEIIPYNNLITLTNVTNATLGSELLKLSPSNGINVVKISDLNGTLFLKAKDFFSFLKVSLPGTLERTLKDEYVIGVFSQNKENSPFIIITVNDFGQAFSAMLDWEENMPKDLSFLNTEGNALTVTDIIPTTATTSAAIVTASTTKSNISSTTASVKIPMKPDIFTWKDIIVKNKDTRGLVNDKDQSKIAYTFLDKNTILITNNLSAIAEIASIYASRAVAR